MFLEQPSGLQCLAMELLPHFFDASVTGKQYRNMLQTYFFPQVQQQEDIYFQQDWAPAHYAHCVCEWLDINFNVKWIGRHGSFDWPARLPDFMGCCLQWAFFIGCS